jgi:hypothetical protein
MKILLSKSYIDKHFYIIYFFRLNHVAFEPSYNSGCNHLCLYLEFLPIDLKRYMDALGPGERLSPRLVKVKSLIDFNKCLIIYI